MPAPRSRARLEVSVSTTPASRVPGLGAWLAGAAPAGLRGEVSVALVGDARMRRLNRTFRGVDTVTDVLAFPSAAPHDAGDPFLGDVVIAAGVARRQARLAGHGFGTEVRVLALHGLLHLAGYDHETDGGEMARVEARLRRRGGLREGLIARAVSQPR